MVRTFVHVEALIDGEIVDDRNKNKNSNTQNYRKAIEGRR